MLNGNQIVVTLALIKLKGAATAEEVANLTGFSQSHTRRILKELRDLGIVDSIRVSGKFSLGHPLTSKKQISPRTKLHMLMPDIEDLLKNHPEILTWAKKLYGVSSADELKKLLEA